MVTVFFFVQGNQVSRVSFCWTNLFLKWFSFEAFSNLKLFWTMLLINIIDFSTYANIFYLGNTKKKSVPYKINVTSVTNCCRYAGYTLYAIFFGLLSMCFRQRTDKLYEAIEWFLFSADQTKVSFSLWMIFRFAFYNKNCNILILPVEPFQPYHTKKQQQRTSSSLAQNTTFRSFLYETATTTTITSEKVCAATELT